MWRPFYLWLRFFFADNFIYNTQKMKIRAFMVSIPILQIVIMELIYFMAIAKEERPTIRWLLYPIFTMLLLCYYRATYAQPFMIPQYDISRLPPTQKCMSCRNWQPERAEHCPLCNKWILKQNSHYPCIANCIGYHNEKFFFLYVVYTLIINFIFIETGLRYTSDSNPDIDVFFVIKIGYWLLNAFIYVNTLIFTLTSISLFLCFFNNVTMLGKSSLWNRFKFRQK